ncbi:hypothetical protein Bbelb_021880 [Branchiostoma belcheri]|nr:hypothetical protein Bbelb_021880 [Branchiostoma belcheri]
MLGLEVQETFDVKTVSRVTDSAAAAVRLYDGLVEAIATTDRSKQACGAMCAHVPFRNALLVGTRNPAPCTKVRVDIITGKAVVIFTETFTNLRTVRINGKMWRSLVWWVFGYKET